MIPPRDGVVAALWTPTDAEGAIDRSALDALLAFGRRHGISGVMPLGSTGEFAFLDFAQKRQVLEIVRESSDSLPVIANISAVNPREVVAAGRLAKDLGCAAVTLLPPWYYQLPEEDLLEFLLRGAESADLPVMLYNFPERTGHRLGPELIANFARRAPMFAIKHSGDEWDYLPELVALGKQFQFAVFTGADPRLAEALALGVAGNVGGLSNFVPDLVVGVFQATRQGNADAVATGTERLKEIDRLCSKVPFPLNMGAGILARGLDPGVPKQVASQRTQDAHSALVSQLREKFGNWFVTPDELRIDS